MKSFFTCLLLSILLMPSNCLSQEYFFWIGTDQNPGIHKMETSTLMVETIVQATSESFHRLQINATDGILYWIAADSSNRIMSCDLNGSSITTLVEIPAEIGDLSFSSEMGQIYLSSSDSILIYAYDLASDQLSVALEWSATNLKVEKLTTGMPSGLHWWIDNAQNIYSGDSILGATHKLKAFDDFSDPFIDIAAIDSGRICIAAAEGVWVYDGNLTRVFNAQGTNSELFTMGNEVFLLDNNELWSIDPNYQNSAFKFTIDNVESFVLYRSEPLSIVENANSSVFDLSIYPNPASNFLSVAMKHKGTLVMEVCDQQGRAVLVQTLNAQNSEQNLLDLHSLDAGIYILRERNSGEMAKFVVSR